MRRKTLVWVLAVCTVAALVGVASANHSWGNYHWARSSNPVSLTIGDNVSSTWDSHLVTATGDWDASSVLDLTIVAGKAKGGNCRPGDGKIEVCNGAYGNNGWLGIAQIWASGDHITKANTRLNDTYHNSPPYNTSAWRQFVTCQEIGHDFGLDHQDEDFNNPNLGTCMDYTSDPSSNQHPNQHDYDQLEAIYAHLDSGGGGGNCNPKSPKCQSGQSNGFSPAPPAMDDVSVDEFRSWGRLVSIARNGGQATFELDFGGGHKIVTHVTFTLEMAEHIRREILSR